MLPFASVNAALHSIIPAPVRSRSVFTIAAVISMFTVSSPGTRNPVSGIRYAESRIRDARDGTRSRDLLPRVPAYRFPDPDCDVHKNAGPSVLAGVTQNRNG